ncbi:NAD-dependent epimerase/dehydratase family protein, partial [Candidatus Parvarchaeota archaeon]|nr:NAD-dependent epimerase/dehydratase family protein [Candidatus Parvarchaeota archaeon]
MSTAGTCSILPQSKALGLYTGGSGLNRILVTGGSGFIGSFLVERLVRENYKVSVLDNNFRGRKSYLDSVMDRIEFVEADITRPQGLHDKLSGFD